MEFMLQENLLAAVRERGKQLLDGLMELAARFPNIGEVRGRGLMWGLEIIDPEAPTDRWGRHPSNGDCARRLKQACLAHGLLIETGGRFGSVLRLLPPLIITRDEIAELLAKLATAFLDVQAHSAFGVRPFCDAATESIVA